MLFANAQRAKASLISIACENRVKCFNMEFVYVFKIVL